MKNQYFGDINDYKKYGLIRQLTGFGEISTAVCWMLTPNDTRPDGHRIHYLLKPEEWRKFDPVVFDHLREQVIERRHRAVSNIDSSNILPNCKFYAETVQDDASQRKAYLQRFLEFARGSDVVFFDPDNGMEVKSIPLGRKNSSRYLYFPEVQKAFSAGQSLLIYQHLARRPRQPLIHDLTRRFRGVKGVSRLYLYWTQFVVFFLLPQSNHEIQFVQANTRIAEAWGNEIKVKECEMT